MYGKYENMKWREEEENSLNRALCCYGKTELGELACLKQDWQCLCCAPENNQIANRKLIHQRRDREREQRDNQERNQKTRTEKALKGVSLRREQPTVLKFRQHGVQERWTWKWETLKYLHGRSGQINFILNDHSLERNLSENSKQFQQGFFFWGLAESLKYSSRNSER